MDISSLEDAYRNGSLKPAEVVERVYGEIARAGERPVWITLAPKEQNLVRARELEACESARSLPLYGIPFAVKDNLDVEGLVTTAACPSFGRIAKQTATVVQRLLDAGAILIGKTNMDQFATGLVGTRTPYGICSSVFNADYISGGSSSGSAVAVARGWVSFALGSDTAGSGRVPAAFNNLVGLKPTRGLLSTRGLLPACRSLDCVSIFAETCADAARVFSAVRGLDLSDPYSRTPSAGEGAAPWSASADFRFGVPTSDGLTFFGDEGAAQSYRKAVEAMIDLGGRVIEFDYAPFARVAAMLYKGPWAAERLAALREFFAADPQDLDATVASIVRGAEKFTAVDTFAAAYALAALRRETEAVWRQVDCLLLPTAPTQYTIEQVLAAPLDLNARLGTYTNFVNLLDLAAVAVPAGFKANGLPFGVSLIGKAFADEGLLRLADRLHRRLANTLGGSAREVAATPQLPACSAPPGCVLMAVVGAHLEGQPLNWQLTERKARLVSRTRTAPDYRLYALANTAPSKPGLVFAPGFAGEGIEVEVWAMPQDSVGSFLNAIPPPLTLGTIRLADGRQVKGFLCEPAGIDSAEEITQFGGWRNYLAERYTATGARGA